jgi:hypothetical protein
LRRISGDGCEGIGERPRSTCGFPAAKAQPGRLAAFSHDAARHAPLSGAAEPPEQQC